MLHRACRWVSGQWVRTMFCSPESSQSQWSPALQVYWLAALCLDQALVRNKLLSELTWQQEKMLFPFSREEKLSLWCLVYVWQGW